MKLALLKSWGEKGFGFASIRPTDGIVENFFLHQTQIVHSQPEVPYPGYIIRFEPGANRPGKNPICLTASVFSPAEKPDAETTERILHEPVPVKAAVL